MIIKSLKLSNYRRFENLDLEFPENIIGIIGRNGAGKSTIIEAVGWVLYGSRFVRTDKKEVRSQFADAKQACRAEMIFSFGGSEYRIVRSLKGKNVVSEAAVYRNGASEAEAVQDRGVDEFIEQLLQLDYRSFTTSVFAQQKELDKLTSLQPEQRRQAINRLINIDRIDRAREQVRRDRNEKQAFVSGKRSALRDIDELKEQKKTLQAEQKKNKQKHQSLKKQADGAKATLVALKEKFNAISKLRDQYVQWDAQIGKLQTRLDEHKKSLKRAEDDLRAIEGAEKELAALQTPLAEFDVISNEKERMDENREKHVKLHSRHRELDLVQKSLQKEQSQRRHASKDADELKARQEELSHLLQREQKLEQQRAKIQDEIKNAHGLMATAENRGREFKQKLEKIEQLGPDGECPVCTQRLADHYGDVVQDHQQQLEQLRHEYQTHRDKEAALMGEQKENDAALAALRREKEQALKKHQSAEQAAKLVEQIDEHIAAYNEQQKLIQAAIDAFGKINYDEERHQQLKEKHKELLGVRQSAAKLEERAGRKTSVESQIKQLAGDIANLQNEINDAKSAQAALGFSEKEYQQVKENVEKKTEDETRAKDELAASAQALAVLQRDITNAEKEIVEQKKAQQEIADTEEEIVYLNALEEHLGLFRLELAGRIRPLIAHRASELLSLTTLSRYSQIDLDQDYNISIFDGNVAFAVERFSGGEQDLANLCLRIAISQVVAERHGGAPINFIVLDEIFGSQDLERRDLILNALAQLSSQFRQIFIITHIEAVKDVLPVLVLVQQENNNYSSAKLE